MGVSSTITILILRGPHDNSGHYSGPVSSSILIIRGPHGNSGHYLGPKLGPEDEAAAVWALRAASVQDLIQVWGLGIRPLHYWGSFLN